MNSPPESQWSHSTDHGSFSSIAATLFVVSISPLFHCARRTTHPMTTDTNVSVYAISPMRTAPQCTTVSICPAPGFWLLHDPAYTGTVVLIFEGEVVLAPLVLFFFLSAPTRRRMVASLIASSCVVASAECFQSPSRFKMATYSWTLG